MGLNHSKRDKIANKRPLTGGMCTSEDLFRRKEQYDDDSSSTLMTSSVDICSSSSSQQVLYKSRRHTCKLAPCFGRRDSNVSCNKCASQQTRTSLDNDVTALNRCQDDEGNCGRSPGGESIHSLHVTGPVPRPVDPIQRPALPSMLDHQTLCELIRQNMAANRVYIPSARTSRHERRMLFWRLRRSGDVVTAITYDTSGNDDKQHGQSGAVSVRLKVDTCHRRRVRNDRVRSPTDVTRKTGHCRSASHPRPTTLDDSGIALEDGPTVDPPCPDRSNCTATNTIKRHDSDIPTTIDCPEVTSKSRPDSDTSTHHWYRHKHRASQERRAMKRVAEWIDRNYGGNHSSDLHGDRSTTADASMVIRVPVGAKLTVVVESLRSCVADSNLDRVSSRRSDGRAAADVESTGDRTRMKSSPSLPVANGISLTLKLLEQRHDNDFV